VTVETALLLVTALTLELDRPGVVLATALAEDAGEPRQSDNEQGEPADEDERDHAETSFSDRRARYSRSATRVTWLRVRSSAVAAASSSWESSAGMRTERIVSSLRSFDCVIGRYVILGHTDDSCNPDR